LAWGGADPVHPAAEPAGEDAAGKYYVPHKVEYEVSLLVEKKDLILVPDSGSGFDLGVADPVVVFLGSWLL